MNKNQKIIIIAGPNGAGKTTFAREFLPNEGDCPIFVNADLIAAGLNRGVEQGMKIEGEIRIADQGRDSGRVGGGKVSGNRESGGVNFGVDSRRNGNLGKNERELANRAQDVSLVVLRDGALYCLFFVDFFDRELFALL